MTYFPNDRIVAFDCDDTLVMWDDKHTTPGGNKIEIIDPYTGETLYLKPHKRHIQKLKGYSQSGWFVMVWSAGGGPWAKTVVDTLKLTGYVDLVIGKPQYLFDDMPLNEAIGTRKYYMDKK